MANENKSAQRGADKPKRNGWRVFGRVIGTIVLVGVLTVLVFACLFALYVKNDLAAQNDFSLEGFALDQTSVIYYEDPKTGQDVVLQKLYGGANRTWVKYEDIPKTSSMPALPSRTSALWSIRASTG